MDHHCPWVNNCVGFRNYKYFYLLLVYGSITEILCISLVLASLLNRSYDGFKAWDYIGMVCIGFVGIVTFGTIGLLVYHTSMLVVNQTTIEHLKALPTSTYSVGCFGNVQQVLGKSAWMWPFPCIYGVSEEDWDGIHWDHPDSRPKPEGHELQEVQIQMHSSPNPNNGQSHSTPEPLGFSGIQGSNGSSHEVNGSGLKTMV
eukprot:CAMPEP_0184304544 /NCGR_PEP_ID=MMETSP1049-20130417/14029_1 /TAXON_ID=77928 /ORGANISM="Proteomonas sulcata, Strain CCMP704" /LENGTH=200 /DNA_ID=CAMNT_0026616367 /DNA_START=18 /DNA_END=620 /DNA_ORIENTATION=+